MTQTPLNSMRRWADRVAALVCGESGTSAVEFALSAPILVGLLVPMADLGMAFSDQIQVQQAATAGAQYAALHPWNSTSATAIANAVTGASTLPSVTASPAARQICGCPSSPNVSPPVAPVTCNRICPNGQTAGYYVVVNAQAPYTPKLPYSALGSAVILTAQATIRVR